MERNSKGKRDKTSARKVVRIPPDTKSVVLGVTGSIAAHKSAELASLLVKQGHEVFVVMTQDATEFISPLTLQTLSKNPVTTSFFDEKENWRPGHIELADRANLLVIAPATAHRGHRTRDARADSTGARNEWKNVGAPRDTGERRKIEGVRRRVYRARRRNARVRLRRAWPAVESPRHRISRRVHAGTPG